MRKVNYNTFLGKTIRHATAMLVFFLFCAGLSAQNMTVSGVVADDSGQGLIGVTVVVAGTTNGTVTDIDGNYSIQAAKGETLEFSYAGFATQRLTVGDDGTLNVGLLTDAEDLVEVVVTGYSIDRRRSTPGSVSTVKAADLAMVPSGDVEQQLQGRVSGVTVISNGQPGTTSQIRVRGYGALGGNEPLYVIDGVPTTSTNFLNPDDIETVTVLKDATAASIYGARAASGVIVYTTKKGKKERRPLEVTYNGMIGATDPGNSPPIMNPQDHADWTWKAVENAATQVGEAPVFQHEQFGSGATPVLPDYLLVGPDRAVSGSVNLADHEDAYNVDPEAGSVYQVVKAATGNGTDWYDAITRTAMLHRHHLGFSGGGVNNRYYVGLGMQEQDGILLHQDFSRYSLRINSEFDLLPSLRIGQNIQTYYRSADIFGSNGGSGSSDDENVVLTASRMPSIIPIYDEFGGYAGTSVGAFNNGRNPVATLDGQQDNRNFQTAIFGNLYAELEPIKNLTFRTNLGGDYGSGHSWAYTRRQYENSENNSSFGFNQASSFYRNWVWTNTANYNVDFGIGSADILVGQEALNFGSGRGMGASGINPFSQSVDFVGISTVGSQVVNGGHGDGVNFASYFGRVNFDLQDKYIVSLVARRDGSSRFGSENRYGVFPAVSVAWRLSSEGFMSDIPFLDDLKIRAGYGIMGNSNNVDPSNQFSLYATSIGASSYDIGGTNSSAQQGFFRSRIGNPFAKWERAITSNIGIDALLLDGKWDIGVEFWVKDTEDLLFQQPVSVMTGSFANAPFVNVGKMRNRGVDFTIVNKGGNNKLRYEVALTGGFLNNEIVELAEGIDNLPNRSASYRGITPVLNQVGQPLSAFYGFEVEGIFADQAEVDGHATQDGAAPGRFKFADIDSFDENGELTGVPDGIIDLADRTNIGNPIPDFTGGLTIKLNYANFGIEMYSFASIGNEIYNVSKLFTDFYPLFPGAAISERVKDSWSFENPNGEIPIFENVSNFSTNTQSNSFYVEDGSYFRLQNLTLSYGLPKNITDRMKMRDIKLTASVNNLLTITAYEGLDPSVGGSADTNFGIDVGNIPITRSFTFGVRAGF